MAADHPQTMKAIIAPSYGKPSNYQLSTTTPTPTLFSPIDVLIKVHAAGLNRIDGLRAAGALKLAESATFPMPIGQDFAGTVVSVGSSVTSLKPGDEVFALVPSSEKGALAEYIKVSAKYVGHKSARMSFVEAASLPTCATTALQALEKADKLTPGGLQGKTVFVPAGLSGTGSLVLQLAKNLFGAGKTITTVSTSKIKKVPELLGEAVVDQIVDYTKTSAVKEVGKGSVDVLIDVMGHTLDLLPIMKPNTGVVVSVATLPSGKQAAEEWPNSSFVLRALLGAVDWWYRFRTGRYGLNYSYLFSSPAGSVMDRVSTLVDEGKLRPVVGSTARLTDVEEVKKGCAALDSGKGGVGKFVVEIA